jgi:hypothetical protein
MQLRESSAARIPIVGDRSARVWGPFPVAKPYAESEPVVSGARPPGPTDREHEELEKLLRVCEAPPRWGQIGLTFPAPSRGVKT